MVRPNLAGSTGKALQHEFVAEKEKPKPAEPVDTEPMLRTLLSGSQLNSKGCFSIFVIMMYQAVSDDAGF